MKKVFFISVLIMTIWGIVMVAQVQRVPPEVEALASVKLIEIQPNDVIIASMNKANGSEYKKGDSIFFIVKIKKSGYLYIIDMPQYGGITQLFPNYYQQNNFFSPGTYKISSTSDYKFTVSGTRSGVEFVQFILSSKPVDFLQNTKISKQLPFAQIGENGKDAFNAFKENLVKSIVIVPQKWTAWTYFYFNAGAITTLNVQSIPSGANVNVDSTMNGITPAIFQVSAGYHMVTLSMNEYQTWSGNVYVDIGENKSINIPLVPIQQNLTGTLDINVSPLNATIYVDNQIIGTGNQVLTLSAGYHSLLIEADNYQSYYNYSVLINPNQTTQLDVNLIPLTGNLYVYSQPYVQIYLDGVYAGDTGYAGYAYITGIPAGYHRIRFSKEWYVSQRMNYNVNPGDNYLSISLSMAGMLKVNSNIYPLDVKIDGQNYGQIDNADKGIFVPAGTYEVELSNPQYLPYKTQLNFSFQHTTTADISLQLKPLEISLRASPNPFSPNGDWFEDNTDFYVNLSRSGYVQISVYASNDSLIWYRNYNAPYGVSSVTWDGNSIDGRPMPNGIYKVVTAVQSYGQSASAQTNVVIDKSHYTYLKEIIIVGGILLMIGLAFLIFK